MLKEGERFDSRSDGEGELVACHECDLLHQTKPIPAGARADCRRCGAELYKNIPNSIDAALALYLGALMLFVMANSYPFMTMKIGGRVEENLLVSGGLALYEMGMGELAVVVFLTSIGFPLVVMVGMLYLLAWARFGRRPPGMGPVYRVVNALTPWSLFGVFMLGTLISFVKLQDLATVIPGVSMFAFAALIVVYSAARTHFDPRALWALSGYTQLRSSDVAPSERVLNCHTCGLLQPAGSGVHKCPRCGTALHHRTENSLQRTWALVFAAGVLFIPANVYPVMTVIQLGKGDPSTILGGVVHLTHAGMWGLAFIVFFASIVVPLAKLATLVFLLRSVDRSWEWRPRDRTFLYRVTEVIGAWSMVDVFLVALLAGLVRLDALATIRPELGATFFAAVVIITMFAAHSFDSRLIWDEAGDPPPEGKGRAPEPAAGEVRA